MILIQNDDVGNAENGLHVWPGQIIAKHDDGVARAADHIIRKARIGNKGNPGIGPGLANHRHSRHLIRYRPARQRKADAVNSGELRRAAPFSPIISDGALVLPLVMEGLMEASMTRNPSMP